MKNKIFIATLIIFLLSLSVRVFWITQKQSLHVDEMFTRTTIIGKRVLGDYVLYSGIGLNYGRDIKNFFFSKPKNSLNEDLKNLRKNNYSDDAHPSLYYSIVRTLFPLTENNLQGFIYLGCGINLIFFTFSFFIMRKILIRLFGDNKLVPIGLIFAFLNTGTISMTLFIRPYEMQILAFVLVSYVYLLINDKVKNNQGICNVSDILTLIFSLTFTFLSGYFLILYVAFLGLILLYNSRKNLKTLFVLMLTPLLSLFFCRIFYSGYFQFLNGQRFVNISDDILVDSIYIDIVSYFCNLTKFLFYGLAFFIILFFLKFMEKNPLREKGLLISAFLWSIIITIISPYLIIRYITPALPILSVFFVWIISKVKIDKQNIIITLMALLYILTSVFPIKNESYDTMILYKQHSFFIPFAGRLENLYISNNPLKDDSLPVLVLNTQKTWFAPLYLIPKLNNNQRYNIVISDTKYNLKNFRFKHFYLLTDINTKTYNYDFEGKYIGDYFRYKCYEILVND